MFRVASVSAQLVGTIAAGLVAEAFGLRVAAALGPLGALAGAVILVASPVRTVRIGALDAGVVAPYEPDTVGEQPIGG